VSADHGFTPAASVAETTRWQGRPSWIFMFLLHRWLLALACVCVAVFLVDRAWGVVPASAQPWIGRVGTIAGLIWVIAAWLSWRSRAYLLTTARLTAQFGVIARTYGEVPLDRIQHAVVTQSILERVLGLGTVSVATAGSEGPTVSWRMIEMPRQVLDHLRAAQADQARAMTAHLSAPTDSRHPRTPPRFVTIGLAGSIGAGKSVVAKILADLGYVVADSDAQAKAELDVPEVRDMLVQWWGAGVLDAQGKVSRRGVAEMIFTQAKERTRLEGLIHPRLAIHRERLRDLAKAQGKSGLVIDAPLLFEAGLDRQCDAVLVVDAPRAIRHARVQASRGWTDEELARRESAQWPIDRKRAQASAVIENDQNLMHLRQLVVQTLARLGIPGGVAGGG
jgi:dephospho-CoA kinase